MMALSPAVDAASASPISRFGLRPGLFDVSVAASARLAVGVVGLTVLVRHASRQFRFAVNASSSTCASSDDVAIALANAIEGAFEHESADAVVEEVVVLLRSGSLPITCEGTNSKNLLPFLRRVVDNIVAPGDKALRG
jgi:hypothetical protein